MKLKNFLLWMWQLPQNIAGFIISRICYVEDEKCEFTSDNIFMTEYFFNSGVSLGEYIIIQKDGVNPASVCHEQGHRKQSRRLGPLYLIIIGLPSMIGNIWDRLFHKKWDTLKRIKWYYSQPWEKWADKLGNVGSRW